MNLGLAVWTLWRREVVRFLRQKNRVIGALGSPLVFWFLIGSGVGRTFQMPGMPSGSTYLDYFFPGTLLLIILFTAIFSTISIIEDRREGFLQGVLVAPVSRWAIVLGKIAGGATLATLQAGIFCALAPVIGLKIAWAALPLLFLVLVLISIGLTGLGYLVAWPLDSTQGFHALMNLFLVPLWLLSGALFPAQGASGWLQWVMYFNPLHYALAALQALLFPQPLPDAPCFTVCVLVLAVFAAATLGICVWMTHRISGKHG